MTNEYCFVFVLLLGLLLNLVNCDILEKNLSTRTPYRFIKNDYSSFTTENCKIFDFFLLFEDFINFIINLSLQTC